MDDIEGVMADRLFALRITHASMPESFRTPFAAAGDKFAADYDRHCASLVLLPELETEFQNRNNSAVGFTLHSASQEAEAFLADAPAELRADYQTTMFLHPFFAFSFDEKEQWEAEQSMHWSLSALIGQAKVNQLVIAKSLSLSETGREAFSLLYQKEMITCLTASSGFGGPRYLGACRYFAFGLSANIAKVLSRMEQSERKLVENLQLFGTADKP